VALPIVASLPCCHRSDVSTTMRSHCSLPTLRNSDVHDGACVIRREDDRGIADLAGDGPASAHPKGRGDGKGEYSEAGHDGHASPGLEHG